VAPSLIKPDVTAPGVNILAGNTPTPGIGAAGELYQAISGTSMASPHAAGLLALIKQAHPDWTPAMAQSALMTTARDNVRKENGVTAADPFDIGGGHIQPGRPDKKNSVFDPGLVYDAGFNDYLGFLCDAAPEVFANPTATCSALAAAGIPTTVENLNYPSIGAAEIPGEITVTRTITNVADKTINWHAKVQNPAGFKVTVTPDKVKLAPGASATVSIRIVNQSAPVGQWRFGTLNWEGAGYKVASPIAARATALGAPAEVSGTGVTGTASFDVRFGYSGSYTAATHGLVAPQGVSGSVDQDPDQTFDPDDPTGTTAHQFTLSGTGHLRIEVSTADLSPADPSVDLDLFLYNEAGQEVAVSTEGGTNERIDLTLPADGTYTPYVHGWQTLGGTVDYTLRTWEVSLSTGGSLVLNSAPGTATNGGVGTIEVGWTGLTPGTTYLGAVSHAGPSGLLGLTLVRVAG